MTTHFDKEIDRLKQSILALSAVVEHSVAIAVRSLDERNGETAKRIIDSDNEIDEMEVDIEEACLKILALHQPVAIDLRFIVACLKINSDLERIGDLAVNIAERAAYLSTHPPVEIPFDFKAMTDKAQEMLKKSLDALVNRDIGLAFEVINEDDDIDNMNREMYDKIQEAMKKNVEQVSELQHLLSASRHLERIGDHATNIAEDVIYMIQGEIVRHKAEDYDKLEREAKK